MAKLNRMQRKALAAPRPSFAGLSTADRTADSERNMPLHPSCRTTGADKAFMTSEAKLKSECFVSFGGAGKAQSLETKRIDRLGFVASINECPTKYEASNPRQSGS